MLYWQSNLVMLTYSDHAEWGWHVPPGFPNLSQCTWLPITFEEMAKTSTHLPIFIMAYEKRWLLAAVMATQPGENHYIRQSDGLQERFLPSCTKMYPFALSMENDPRARRQLCIDQFCLVPMNMPNALPLFNTQRQFSEDVSRRFNMLHRFQIDGEVVQSACDLLAEKGLLSLVPESEKIILLVNGRITPIYRMDIDAVERLSRADFADLQMHHAMELGIHQYSSQFHLDKLRYWERPMSLEISLS